VPRIQRSMLSKDVDAMQRTSGLRAAGGDVHAVRVRRHPAQRGSPLLADRRVNIAEACAMQISELAEWVDSLDEPSAAPLLSALKQHLDSFARSAWLPLAGPAVGHAVGRRGAAVKMIRQLGSSLTDVTYVFDEPTVGLHPHDIQRMNDLLLRLRDKGNTVLVVEHKPETIAIADHAVDLGPGAGTAGGAVCFEGTVEGLRASDTITGRHLGDRAAVKETLRTPAGTLEIRHATNAQPARRRRRHPARGAGRRHRCGRLGQELADPRLVSGRDGVMSVDQARSAAHGGATRPPTPGCSTRSARRSRRPTA